MNDRSKRNEGPDRSNLLTDFSNLCDRYVYEIRYISYCVAAAGALIIFKRTYAFRKFLHIAEIPKEFVKGGVKLRGHVRTVCENGNLQVEHIPVFYKPFTRNKCDGNLTVCLAGIDLAKPGLAHLKSYFLEKHIWFKILNRDECCLQCIIFYKRSFWRRNIVLNEHLVRNGLATVSLSNIPYSTETRVQLDCNRLIERLVRCQKSAARSGRGIWQEPSLRERIKAYPANMKNYGKSVPRNIMQSFTSSLIKYFEKCRTLFSTYQKTPISDNCDKDKKENYN